MRQLILVEDFKNGLTAVMTTYINEETADTLQKAATLADEFILTQMVTFNEKPREKVALPTATLKSKFAL